MARKTLVSMTLFISGAAVALWGFYFYARHTIRRWEESSAEE